MSLLKSIFKEEKKHMLGVCIPEHARQKQEDLNLEIKKTIERETHEEAKTKKKKPSTAIKGAFRTQGIYRSGDTVMLKGKVERGVISKKMKSEFKMKKFNLRELQKKGEMVKTLKENEEGAIYLDSLPVSIKMGDLLEFW